MSLVTDVQQRTVRRMQRDLDLRAPIEKPRLDALHNGGHRIGRPRPKELVRNASSTRPAVRTKSVRTKKRQPRRAGKEAQSVYVANLPWGATTEEVQALFGDYGEVHQTTIITDRRTGRSKGFGFVDMAQPAARDAIDALDGFTMGGRNLTVRFARPRRQRR